MDSPYHSESFRIIPNHSESFRIIAKTASNPQGPLIAEVDSSLGYLPRIAPLVIPVYGIPASRIRIEASSLTIRAFDQRYALQLSEVLIFSGNKNIALRRPVSSSSSDSPKRRSPPWRRKFLVDGHTPYLMDAAIGEKSTAYLKPVSLPPVLTVDLGASHSVSSIHLHAVDQSDTVPQAYAGNHGIPHHLKIQGAKLADFSDAVTLLEANCENIVDTGPFMMWNIPETLCRYIRIAETEQTEHFRIGFSEIKIFEFGQNVALGKPVLLMAEAPLFRSLESLTDGRNLYGEILPIRTWINQLARRHDLETERPQVAYELAQRYDRQKLISAGSAGWLDY